MNLQQTRLSSCQGYKKQSRGLPTLTDINYPLGSQTSPTFVLCIPIVGLNKTLNYHGQLY